MTEITTSDHGERLARVEGAVEQINGTLQQLSARLDSLERQLSARLDSLERQLSARLDSLEKRINWLIGFQFHHPHRAGHADFVQAVKPRPARQAFTPGNFVQRSGP